MSDWDRIADQRETPSPARVEAFSDAVFAIIITLLVLDLHVPRKEDLDGHSLAEVLLQQWPLYLSYVLSFLQVGVVWANHHTMFHYIHRSDHVLLFNNLMLLLCTALLPFTTAIFAEYGLAVRSDIQVAAFIYSAALGAAGVFFNLVWRHALHAHLVNPHADPHRLHALSLHWMFMPVFYAVAFVLTLMSPYLRVAMYALAAVLLRAAWPIRDPLDDGSTGTQMQMTRIRADGPLPVAIMAQTSRRARHGRAVIAFRRPDTMVRGRED